MSSAEAGPNDPASPSSKRPYAKETRWCMDFKGFFRCGNRERCDPFTITDAYSRYLIVSDL